MSRFTGTRVEVGQSQGELVSLLARYGSPFPVIDSSCPGWLHVRFLAEGQPFILSLPCGRSPQAQREGWRKVLAIIGGHLDLVSSGGFVSPEAAVRPMADPSPPPFVPASPPVVAPSRRWNVLTGRRPLALPVSRKLS